jgi:hypothetical protein
MATYSNVPGTLNLIVRGGDELGVAPGIGLDLTGTTATSTVYSQVTGANVATMTTTLVVAGGVSTAFISMTETQTAALPVGTYGWRQVWNQAGSVQRTGLSGILEVTR